MPLAKPWCQPAFAPCASAGQAPGVALRRGTLEARLGASPSAARLEKVIGPELLLRAHERLARYASLIITLLLIYVAAVSVIKAMHRPFWFDEIFTVTIARMPSMHDVWRALTTSADANPPGFYVAERFLASLVDNERLGFRLASIVTVPFACLSLFLFMRRDTDAVAGSIAAVFPLLTVLYSTFSIEARPYGLMACFLAIAALAWQRASRPAWSFGLALSLIAAISVHYYALFALIPFAAAEAARIVSERRVRLNVWLAFGAAAVSILMYWPMLVNLRRLYGGRYYWSTATIFRAIASYDEYMSLIPVGAMLGVIALLSGALLLYLVRAAIRGEDDPVQPGFAPANCVLALGLLWMPWIALGIAKMTDGGLAARYAIGTTLGLAMSASYVSFWLGQRMSAVMLILLLTAFGSKEAVYWGAEWYGLNPTRVDVASFERLLESAQDPTLPIVVTNGMEFVPLTYYVSPPMSQRLVALIDREAAREHLGSDSIEVDLLVLQECLPITVQTYDAFETQHQRFLLYASPGHGDWWQERLLRDGLGLTTIAADGSRVLYRVERKNPPAANRFGAAGS